MSPTSYQTAPPRARSYILASPNADRSTRAGARERRESGPWPASSSPAACPATRSTAWPPSTTSTSGRATCRPPRDELRGRRRRRRGAAVRCSPTASTRSCSTPRRELRAIANYAVGSDNIDLEAAAARGIPVGVHARRPHRRDRRPRLRAACSPPPARIARGRASASRDGEWRTWEPQGWLGADVHGATLAIVGAGRIGQAVARRAAGFEHGGAHGRPRRRPALGARRAPTSSRCTCR